MPLNEALKQVVQASPVRTQVRLATAIGVDQRTVSRYYTAENTPDPSRIAAIEDACAVARGIIYALAGLASMPGVIDGDPALSPAARRQLHAAYRRVAGGAP